MKSLILPETVICDKCDLRVLKNVLVALILRELTDLSPADFSVSVEKVSDIGIMVGFIDSDIEDRKIELFVGFDEEITVQELADKIVDLVV